MYNVAIVGSTGNVGRKFLEILEERNFPINNIVMDIFGKCKRWGSIIFLFRVRAGDIRRPVGTAGISVYL